jgi:hypothetical protein
METGGNRGMCLELLAFNLELAQQVKGVTKDIEFFEIYHLIGAFYPFLGGAEVPKLDKSLRICQVFGNFSLLNEFIESCLSIGSRNRAFERYIRQTI